jgi:dedicator of cytokinesis protein 3
LAAAYEKAVRLADERSQKSGRVGEMEAVKEEEEEEGSEAPPGMEQERQPQEEGRIEQVQTGEADAKPKTLGATNGLGRENRPKCLVLEARQTSSQEEKEQPPLPKLTAGDSTLAGAHWPLVDEIACAIREWYGVCGRPF